ncbi:hypothetical protein AWENTII_008782 [Aspergillus wentii]|nr:hypothetical protein MW887_005444 [Aspergillus wentii]
MDQNAYLRSLNHDTQSAGTQPALAPSTTTFVNTNQQQPTQGNLGLAPSNQPYTLLPSPSSSSSTNAPPSCDTVQPANDGQHTMNVNDAMQSQMQMPSTAAPNDTYPHQITGLGGPTATAPFLQDFSLVAEAAKRAQMSVVMRDLESVTL